MKRTLLKHKFSKVSGYGLTTEAAREGKPAQRGLAVTPSEMMRLADQGIPIASNMDATQFYDGDDSPNISLPREFERGYDAIDAYNDEMDARAKLSDYRIKHRKRPE